MNIKELEMLNTLKESQDRLITAQTLAPVLKDRTLLYGYCCDRSTFHVYLMNGKIHVVVYKNNYTEGLEKLSPEQMREINVTHNSDYIPDKRLYPEFCDYKFCYLLTQLGYDLPFTAWADRNQEATVKEKYNPKNKYIGFTHLWMRFDEIMQLAADIDKFFFDYDFYEYADEIDITDEEERQSYIEKIAADIVNNDISSIQDAFTEYSEEDNPEEVFDILDDIIGRLKDICNQ